mmetsp:Transcript_22251/g.72126  ORF Transcript_22251/g.72126 Transcript_22251/m.72126 type:complete len:196 (-) Transcript_22251:677-1264(-)
MRFASEARGLRAEQDAAALESSTAEAEAAAAAAAEAEAGERRELGSPEHEMEDGAGSEDEGGVGDVDFAEADEAEEEVPSPSAEHPRVRVALRLPSGARSVLETTFACPLRALLARAKRLLREDGSPASAIQLVTSLPRTCLPSGAAAEGVTLAHLQLPRDVVLFVEPLTHSRCGRIVGHSRRRAPPQVECQQAL